MSAMICIVHIPKTAGTSLNEIFIRQFGRKFLTVDPWVDRTRAFSPADLRLLRESFPHVQYISSHRLHPYVPLEEVEPGIKFLTVLRSPIPCYKSLYFHNKFRSGRFSSLAEFLSYKPFHNRQTKFLCGEEDIDRAKSVLRERVSFVLLTEMLTESVKLLRGLVPECRGLPDPLHTNPSSASNADAQAEEVDWQSRRDEIEAANLLDLELYRFASEELFPEYRRLAAADETKSDWVVPCVGSLSTFRGRAAYAYQRVKYKSALRTYRSSGWKRRRIDIECVSKTHQMFPNAY